MAEKIAAATLEKNLRAIEKTLSGAPGYALGYALNGTIVHEAYGGFANVEHQVPVTHVSPFNIGSMSKQFTAAAIVLLVRQKRLACADKLTTLLPVPTWCKGVTLTHLLQHTSGINDERDSASDSDTRDIYQYVSSMGKPAFDPGSKHEYSNTGYGLLARVVEKTSGISFPEFLSRNIFTPLGMCNTFLEAEGETMRIPNLACGYTTNAEGTLYATEKAISGIGATGIFSTFRDMKRWNRALDANLIFTTLEQRLMEASGVLHDGTAFHYGFGLDIGHGEYAGIVYHSGSDEGYVSFMARNPQTKSCIVLLVNLEGFPGDGRSWKRLQKKLLDCLI